MLRFLAPLIALLTLAVACGGADVTAVPWRLSAPPDGTTLEIRVAVGNGCNSIDSVKVDEFSDFVRVTAYSRFNDPGPNGGCDDLLKIDPYTVHIKEPLGNRRLEGCDPGDMHGAFPTLDDGCESAIIGP